MKKTYFLATIFYFLILTACNKDDSLSANVVEDETFRSYLLQNFDTDKDGKFSKEEIAAAKTIDVSNRGITSIKGIEIFHAIETLKCNNNNIEELTLLENNELIYLDCSDNKIVTCIRTPKNSKLKYLDYSNNKDIIYYPDSNPELEYLDLSNTDSYTSFILPKLKYLKCVNCDLHDIRLFACKELIYLDISNNHFYDGKPIDLTYCNNLNTLFAGNNPTLEAIQLQEGHEIAYVKIDSHTKIIYKPVSW